MGHQACIGLEKVYDSVRREILHIILIEFLMPMILGGLIEMCLKEKCSIC
jgi:hypothetical protein